MTPPDPGSRPVETELKLLLPDREAVRRLIDALGPESTPQHQVNVYFDDGDGTWSAAGWAVRLRRENGSLKLTVKTTGTARGDFVERGEWETDLDPDREAALSDGGAPLLQAVERLLGDQDLPPRLREAGLRPVGTMRNLRRRAPLPGFEGLVVECDETTYPNGEVLYEAELEVEDASGAEDAVSRLRSIFERLDLPWRPSDVSKRARLERVLRGGAA
ncbi:MAG TPA: CYTH domain-containing protein [Candidatus Krumholzibacteria bacterium]|nr:CYTH domain-containing protein [Candidatus Krumholzibacteria bacterium]